MRSPTGCRMACALSRRRAAATPDLPDTAGGLALAYNLSVGGQRVTSLPAVRRGHRGHLHRSDHQVNDPKIAADNPGLKLPPTVITPVVRSDGDGDDRACSPSGCSPPTTAATTPVVELSDTREHLPWLVGIGSGGRLHRLRPGSRRCLHPWRPTRVGADQRFPRHRGHTRRPGRPGRPRCLGTAAAVLASAQAGSGLGHEHALVAAQPDPGDPAPRPRPGDYAGGADR